MKTAQYSQEPAPFVREALTSVFRWNITEAVNDEGDTIFECFEVRIKATPTPDVVKAAAIRARWSVNEELKIINDYNARNLGVDADDQASEAYAAFIEERNAIKSAVEDVFR